jgi:4-hydroxysphinganine ceramide fatty acyl 2-hydroxylase
MIAKILIALALGCFTWTFLEYCIHRWLGHGKRFRRNVFDREHTRHHVEGDYFAPWYKKLLAAVVATVILLPPAVLVTSFWVGAAFTFGLVSFYLFYEVLHRLLHVHHGFSGYGRWARRHHFYHHFVDARVNHGVTSPLWDHVFGTYRKPEVITVPRKLMMPWLGDPDTGVRPEFADTFALKRRPA